MLDAIRFMYANCFGVEGVKKVSQIMKAEIVQDATQSGITDLRNVSSKLVNFRALDDTVFLLDA